MSSDDELYGTDSRRRRSLATPVPPSAGGNGRTSPGFENDGRPTAEEGANEDVRRTSTTSEVNVGVPPAANEIVEADERVRRVLFSDVRIFMNEKLCLTRGRSD